MNEHFGIKGKAVIVWDFLFSCSSHTPWTQPQINWWTDSLQSLWLNHVPKKINIVGQGVDSPLHKLPSINSNALGQSSLTPCFWRWSSVVRLEKPLLFVQGWTKKVWIKSQGWSYCNTAVRYGHCRLPSSLKYSVYTVLLSGLSWVSNMQSMEIEKHNIEIEKKKPYTFPLQRILRLVILNKQVTENNQNRITSTQGYKNVF